MVIMKMDEKLAEVPILACANCHNPVPNDQLPDARHNQLGPCPRCGGEQLENNPYNPLTYSSTSEYPGYVGLMFVGELFQYTGALAYKPKINTEKKRRSHPLVEMLESALGL